MRIDCNNSSAPFLIRSRLLSYHSHLTFHAHSKRNIYEFIKSNQQEKLVFNGNYLNVFIGEACSVGNSQPRAADAFDQYSRRVPQFGEKTISQLTDPTCGVVGGDCGLVEAVLWKVGTFSTYNFVALSCSKERNSGATTIYYRSQEKLVRVATIKNENQDSDNSNKGFTLADILPHIDHFAQFI